MHSLHSLAASVMPIGSCRQQNMDGSCYMYFMSTSHLDKNGQNALFIDDIYDEESICHTTLYNKYFDDP